MISREALNKIKRFEGFSPLEYTCVAGKRTIGYGHVLRPDENYVAGVTEKSAEILLAQDVAAAESVVDGGVEVELSRRQREALVSFAFNIGARAFYLSSLRRVLNAGRYDQVPKQMMRWVYADGKICAGLVKRRRAEAVWFSGAAGASGRNETGRKKRPVFSSSKGKG